MFVVTVVFEVKSGHTDAFRAAILENAQTSVRAEPGCKQFDVCQDPERPDAFFLYELYDDAAAFEAHKAAPHFLAFDTKTADWVASKTVATYQRL